MGEGSRLETRCWTIDGALDDGSRRRVDATGRCAYATDAPDVGCHRTPGCEQTLVGGLVQNRCSASSKIVRRFCGWAEDAPNVALTFSHAGASADPVGHGFAFRWERNPRVLPSSASPPAPTQPHRGRPPSSRRRRRRPSRSRTSRSSRMSSGGRSRQTTRS